MSGEATYSGDCLCGDIKFTLHGESATRFTCFCTDCRKNSGHLGQALAIYDTSKVDIQDPKNYRKEYVVTNTKSGFPKRKVFCSNCGCTLLTLPMKHNGEKSVVRTTLLNGGFQQVAPTKALFAETKDEYLNGFTCEYL